MTTPKQYVWIAVGVVFVVAIAWLVLYLNKPTTTVEVDTLPYQPDTTTSRVFIKNLEEYSQYFAKERHLSIEQTLHSFVIRSGATPDLFTGVVREGSFYQSNSENSNSTARVMVDVHPADITYLLEIESGGDSADIKPIDIRCAPSEYQINPSIKCVSGVGVE